MLVSKFGTLSRAWRVLDIDGSGKMDMREFCQDRMSVSQNQGEIPGAETWNACHLIDFASFELWQHGKFRHVPEGPQPHGVRWKHPYAVASSGLYQCRCGSTSKVAVIKSSFRLCDSYSWPLPVSATQLWERGVILEYSGLLSSSSGIRRDVANAAERMFVAVHVL